MTDDGEAGATGGEDPPPVREAAVRATTTTVVTAMLGRIEQYDCNREEWTQYEERLYHFFEANLITDPARKRAVFLSVVGPATYKLLHDLLAPDKPGEKSFTELLAALKKHYSPQPSEVVERFKFHTRVRKPGESIANFIASLRALAEHCNFGTSLELMLRDRLVCGINDDTIQKRLLAETNLTYARAVELARGLEAADKNVKVLKNSKKDPPKSEDTSVHQVTPGKGRKLTCYRCGKEGHTVAKCRWRPDVICYQCGKQGHLQRACKSTGKKGTGPKRPRPGTKTGPGKARSVCQVEEESDDENLYYVSLHQVEGTDDIPPLMVPLRVDDKQLEMEIDTGASVSLMSENTFNTLWPGRSLNTTKVRLRSYKKEPIPVLGSCVVNITYKDQEATNLPLIIVQGGGPSLLGRNWLKHIVLDWREIHCVHSTPLQALLDKYASVFGKDLGTLKDIKAKIYVDPTATPKFCRARTVPYAIRGMVEAELKRMQEEGIVEPVETSEWATPIVPVIQANKSSVRICGDFKVTVNPVSKLDSYPIPNVEDLFATLKKGKTFTKLDLRSAYQQVLLEDESKKYVVINTHRGLFRYKRLPFGLSSAPGIFQRIMDNLLQGIPEAVAYIDDILITGPTEEAHLKNLEEVLERLSKAGVRVKLAKCKFMQPSVTYLGHRIDHSGLHPLTDKVQAIQEAPSPQSVSELKSYLGLLTYYGKFLPNLSSVLSPLYRLLRKDCKWRWSEEEEAAFKESKNLLISAQCLTHFDSELPLVLACDASSYGIGAVLAHKMKDGSEKPIGYASRTLSSAERNYSQLEKEGLSCIFGIKKFHNYLFGHSFELITDHKPLLGLLKESQATSAQASARIKRWSLFLSSYEYKLVFRDTKAHANADALSRLPLLIAPATTEVPPEMVLLMEHLEESPVTAKDVRTWTRKDPLLSRVYQHVMQGWPEECGSELDAFSSKQTELSAHDGCLLWGTRVIIPEQGRDAVLSELHEGHPGMNKMKALARMYVWWPNIDKDIEKSVRNCIACQEVQASPQTAPLSPWKWPTRPWTRLHLDFAGPFENHMFLVLIDAHSKWIEAFKTSQATSKSVIEELRTVFARFGIPETIVTDNGTCFTSAEFEAFLTSNGIKHMTSVPYHPASNGLAERAVQILKRGLKKVTTGDIRSRIAKVLFTYRLAPHATTGVSPSELLLGRRPRTRLDLVRPNLENRVQQKQQEQKAGHDGKAKARSFSVTDLVYVKNFGKGRKWLPGTITAAVSSVSYKVRLPNGRVRQCHVDHLRSRTVKEGMDDVSDETEADDLAILLPIPPSEPEQVVPPVQNTPEEGEGVEALPSQGTTPPREVPPTTPPRVAQPATSRIPVRVTRRSRPPVLTKTYPTRIWKHPDWYRP